MRSNHLHPTHKESSLVQHLDMAREVVRTVALPMKTSCFCKLKQPVATNMTEILEA